VAGLCFTGWEREVCFDRNKSGGQGGRGGERLVGEMRGWGQLDSSWRGQGYRLGAPVSSATNLYTICPPMGTQVLRLLSIFFSFSVTTTTDYWLIFHTYHIFRLSCSLIRHTSPCFFLACLVLPALLFHRLFSTYCFFFVGDQLSIIHHHVDLEKGRGDIEVISVGGSLGRLLSVNFPTGKSLEVYSF